MKTDPRSVLVLAGLAVASYAIWRAYSAGQSALASAGAAAERAVAGISEAWANLGSIAPEGDPLKKLLYGGSNYTGLDVNGQSVTDGDLGQSPELLRYLYDYNKARAAAGQPAVTTTTNGAAFGVYPSSGKRRTP